ncbi:MAG TPA: 5-methyltetrahydropteroyltriglutamate--homocysteine S-methyltransferase [Acidimicrobiia bacterium]
MSPPFRADHVGSLLRPRSLKDAFRAHEHGELDDDGLRCAQDEAIRDAVRLQEDVGLHSITDGEFRRAWYYGHFVDAVEGLRPELATFEFRDDRGDRLSFTGTQNEGRLRRTRPISTGEFEFLKAVTTETPKITMPSPSTMHFWRGPQSIDSSVYPTLAAFFADLVGIFRAEIGELADRGARYIQMDEVALAMLCDPDVRAAVAARGEDAGRLVETYLAATNDALGSRPDSVTATFHLCRGNYKGHWLASGGYEPVAEQVFGGLSVDGLFLEFDSERAGDFAPLRFVPEGVDVVLGLVSSKSPRLEDADGLVRRIEDAAAFVPVDRLALSPQCGFASTAGGNPLTEDDERRKLALVVEIAERVWGR